MSIVHALSIFAIAYAVRIGLIVKNYSFEFGQGLENFFQLRNITPVSSKSFIQKFPGDLELLLDFEPDFVFDYSENLFYLQQNSNALASKTEYRYNTRNYNLLNPLAKHFREPLAFHLEAAKALACYFGWTEANLLITADEAKQLTPELGASMFTVIVASESPQQSVVEYLITREVRKSGVRPIFVLSDSGFQNSVLQALAKYQMDAGYAVILLGSNCQFDMSLYSTGVLCVTLSGSESAMSSSEVDYWYALYALTNKPLTEWTIINTVEETKNQVGSIKGGLLTLSSLVVFPGGLLTSPDNSPFPIFINLNNLNGGDSDQRVYQIALNDTPLSTRRFVMSVSVIDACGSYDLITGYLECYNQARAAKVSILVSSEETATLIYQLEFMRVTGLRLPVINSYFIVPLVSSYVLYPNFTRIIQTINYYMNSFVLFYRYFNYDKTHFYIDADFGTDFHDTVVLIAAQGGIEVMTPTNQSIIPSSSGADVYKQAATVVLESQLRPVYTVFTNPMLINLLKAFYDVGLRAKDLVILAPFVRIPLLLSSISDPSDLEAVNEFLETLVAIQSAFFVGDYGQEVRESIQSSFSDPDVIDCYSYDTVTQAIIASDFAIKRGLNFYYWQDMEFAIRSIRFVGCSGQIQQTFNDNNRKDVSLEVTQWRNVEEVLTEFRLMIISTSGTQNFFILGPFIWAQGASVNPLQSRLNYLNCPFPEEYRQTTNLGVNQATVTKLSLAGLAIVSALVSYLIYYRKQQFVLLNEPILLSTQDRFMILFYFSDFIIIYLSSPSSLSFANSVGWLSNLNQVSWSNGAYFGLVSFAISALAFWLVLAVIVIIYKFKPLKIDIQLVSFFILKLSGFLFAIVFNLFDCSEAASSSSDVELTDTFMDLDCFEFCWTGKHLMYSITSIVLLGVYLMLSIPLSPMTCNTLEGLQFETNSSYLLIRQPLLLTLLALHRADLSLLAHAVLYFVVLGVFLVYCLFTRIFDIPSLTIWHNSFLCIVILSSFFSVLYAEGYIKIWLCLVLMMCSLFSALLIASLKLRKSVAFIQPEVKLKTSVLFAFAFSRVKTDFSTFVRKASRRTSYKY